MNLERLNIVPSKKAQFNKKGIYTAEDLVQYLPVRYKDFTVETGILPDTEVSTVSVKLIAVDVNRQARTPYVRAKCVTLDTNQFIFVTWFRQHWMYNRLLPFVQRAFYLAGKISYSPVYRNFNCLQPDLFEPNIAEARRVYPVYPKITGMADAYLSDKIRQACGIAALTSETLPYDIVDEYHLLSRKEALYRLHFPASMDQVDSARRRVLFDDLLYFAAHNEWAKRAATPGSPYGIITLEKYNKVRAALPFHLTNDQASTVEGMIAEVKEGRRINALVQGDVGCGKTIVAILMMVVMADNGYQSVLMAPTQVLARQHYEDITSMLEPFGLKAVYLGSELKSREKKAALRQIADGEADIVVGTNAVIGDAVEYRKLALAIVDEEHRFGVEQRAAIVKKAAEGVHNIKMSATPIPRSLAQVMYGAATQLYTIRSMPAGRKPVNTGLINTREKLFRFIVREARAGHQTYVVCPLIEQSDSEHMDGVRSVEEVEAEYRQVLGPYGVRIATLTGRNSKDETKETIEQFKNGGLDVLISTTVIEVGVNVPTATVMVISNAERFGLATMHQLRGRVGRSSLQAYCVLDSSDRSEKAMYRFKAMCNTTDGFKIAEEDLKIRGAGDFLGTRQSGDNKYMALMMAYPDEYAMAQKVAERLFDSGSTCPLMKKVKAERDEMDDID